MADTQERWAVVGGGLLGLTLALRLARAGRRVVVFEAEDHLGGLAASMTLGDVVCDRYYHVIPLSDTHTRDLLNELDLEQDIEWAETRTGFFTDGCLHSMSNTLEFLTFPPLGLLDKVRLGGTIFCASKMKNWQRLERVTAADWLRRWSGPRNFEKMWLPLLRAKLGENAFNASAVFIWSTIARMYAARRTGLKKEMFGFLPGGYSRVLDRLGEELNKAKVDVALQRPVRRVRQSGAGVEVSTDEGQDVFDRVVLTVPCPQIAAMCEGLSDDDVQRLNSVVYQGITCMALLLKKPLADFYVTNITDSGLPFTAVIEMSALADRKHFGGNALVYLPKYVPQDDPTLSLSDDALADSFLAALESMYPHFHRDDVICQGISRTSCAVPILTLDYSAMLPPMDTSLPGVHIVNSAHVVQGTQNVNEVVALADEASEHLCSTRKEETDLAA